MTDTSEAARQLAAQRKWERRICEVCGAAFEGTTRAKFCSTACKLKAYRRRKAGEAAPTAE